MAKFHFSDIMDHFLDVPVIGQEVEIVTEHIFPEAPLVPLQHPIATALQENVVLDITLSHDASLARTALTCILAAKAPGTVKVYTSVITSFEKFCSEHSHPFPLFPPGALMQYLLHTIQESKSFNTIAKIKPAISYFEQALDRASSFTPSMDLIISGAKRQLSAARSPVKKAALVSAEELAHILSTFVLPHTRDTKLIDASHFRTCFRLLIEYHTLK